MFEILISVKINLLLKKLFNVNANNFFILLHRCHAAAVAFRNCIIYGRSFVLFFLSLNAKRTVERGGQARRRKEQAEEMSAKHENCLCTFPRLDWTPRRQPS